MVHVVSWMDCLDLRLLAILANSTLSSSRYPHQVFFHFFIPEGNEDKVSFFKLKVLFPHSNLEIHEQEEVKEIVRAATSGTQLAGSSFAEIAPFIILSVHRSLSKFLYLSPNILMKGFDSQKSFITGMVEVEEVLGRNRLEDVSWLCSLSESELDMLISLKMILLQRAKTIGHDNLAENFDLKMLRALGCTAHNLEKEVTKTSERERLIWPMHSVMSRMLGLRDPTFGIMSTICGDGCAFWAN